MGQAEQNPSPNKKVDPVNKFMAAYGDVIGIARVSETHTATEGWQLLYGQHRAENRDRRRELAKRLRNMADHIELGTPSEEDDKTIGEFKKECTAIREAEQSFTVQTINPVKQPVLDCEHVISQARATARREESDAPMLNIGLEQLMRDAIDKVAKPAWDEETGRVMIYEPAPVG